MRHTLVGLAAFLAVVGSGVSHGSDLCSCHGVSIDHEVLAGGPMRVEGAYATVLKHSAPPAITNLLYKDGNVNLGTYCTEDLQVVQFRFLAFDPDDDECEPGTEDTYAFLEPQGDQTPEVAVWRKLGNGPKQELNSVQLGQMGSEWVGTWTCPTEPGEYSFRASGVLVDKYEDHPDSDDPGVLDINGYRSHLILLKVESVEWLYHVSETAITTPNDYPESSAAIGLKYDPSATLPSGDWQDKVKVRVTIVPPISGIPVYLKDIDPDDPSANDAGNPIDADTSGGDNKGSSALAVTSGTTDNSGQATIEYTVSHQPGDNHRIAATLLDASNLAMLNNNNVPPNNDQLTGFWGKISDLFTVWRRLWLEIDSMREEGTTESTKSPDINSFIAESVTVDPVAGTSEIDTFGPIFAPTVDFYEGGEVQRVFAPLAGPFKVLRHTANSFFGDQIVVNKMLTPAEISALVDRIVRIRDDDQHAPQLPYFPSVNAAMVAAYKDAYIDLVAQPFNPNALVNFELNLEAWEINLGVVWNNAKDNDPSESYWCAFQVTTYQGPEDSDGEPDNFITNTAPPLGADGFVDENGDRTPGEECTLGGTPIFANAENGSLFFVEPIREFDEIHNFSSMNHVRIHELGHVGQAQHADLGVMTYSMSLMIKSNIPPKFSAASIARFRSQAQY